MSATETIAVAMSGGVDSSTVAAILARGERTPEGEAEGRPAVVGLTLQLWDQTRLAGKHGIPEAPKAGRCCSLDDVYDARRVATHLGIPYYVVNQEERFERDVVRPFVDEYLAGRTPIPCSLCNNHIKFDQLLKTARSIGADRIATGHYAVNEYDPTRDEGRGRWILKRPADRAKDQTYFLFGLTQEQLAHTMFPLGHMTKPEVRAVARTHGLALAEKPDSQEVCFIPGGDYKQFLTAYLEEQGREMPDSAGELVASNGDVIGHHDSISGFTVGQRKGLKVSSPSPLYVLNIDPASHRVTVGADEELATRELRANRVNWISIPELTGQMRVRIKIRHRHEPAWATIEPRRGVASEGTPSMFASSTAGKPSDAEVLAIFDEPQRAVTPGQSAVFYDGDEVVGGGWIL
ncbi:MAG TPA: tRNA 2-thiouridine(34) synthase MnmA [Terracidiphilus sp.]|nr:tRNA 2-thiouridine(34) synthase MnmA [Terracidiphilus sp.]